MPNCLTDNLTGHSCDPYVLLRDIRLYLFLYCEHFSEARDEPVTSLAHLNSIATWRIFHHLFYHCSG